MPESTDLSARVAGYWDAVADRYLSLFRHELLGKPYDVDLLKEFAAAMGPGARVCDVGCGPCGHVARVLAESGLAVVGIDISRECLRLATQEQPDLRFVVMDMAHMAFRPGEFDGIVAYYSLHYQPRSSLALTLREFARVLRPGGRILVAVKAGNGEGWIPDPMGGGGEVFWCSFEPDELTAAVSGNGFAVLSCGSRSPYADEMPVERVYVVAERMC